MYNMLMPVRMFVYLAAGEVVGGDGGDGERRGADAVRRRQLAPLHAQARHHRQQAPRRAQLPHLGGGRRSRMVRITVRSSERAALHRPALCARARARARSLRTSPTAHAHRHCTHIPDLNPRPRSLLCTAGTLLTSLHNLHTSRVRTH